MHFADRFPYLRESVPEDDVAVAYVADRDDLGRARMQFPIQQGSEDEDNGNKSPAAHDTPNHLLISESDADGSRRANHASIWIHQPHFADCLIECDRLDFAGSEANHSSELSA